MQLVHQNDFGDILILSVVLENGSNEGDSILEGLDFGMWRIQENQCLSSNVDLNRVVEQIGKSYYSYLGSDTLPPCNEGVKWLIIENPLQISHFLLNEIHEKVNGEQLNSRQIQWNRRKEVVYHYEPKCDVPKMREDPDEGEKHIVKVTTRVNHYAIVPKQSRMGIKDGMEMGKQGHRVKFEVLNPREMERREPRVKNSLMTLLGKDIYRDVFMSRRKRRRR